ncbi:MAG: hypothetical protein NC548_50005 [Lachnospiraceae bacterium]|nr:hypothetical protein [Lachnospiraceae bacterium]MCM1232970.1 hypothetical protein [Ruminococcus flavefaciens]
MELKPNERAEQLFPVGVKYICEFCGEGEMTVQRNKLATLGVSMRPDGPMLFPHVCSHCGKEMQLPEPYPKLEWVDEAEYHRIFPKNYRR